MTLKKKKALVAFQNLVFSPLSSVSVIAFSYCQIQSKHNEQNSKSSINSCDLSPMFRFNKGLFIFTSLCNHSLSLFSREPWKTIMSWKGSRDWGCCCCCCCCSVSVCTRCWLWLKEEGLLLNTAAPLHREHYPLSNQHGHASKPTHYFLSYPNFLIWVRLDGGFFSSCAPTSEPKPLLQ